MNIERARFDKDGKCYVFYIDKRNGSIAKTYGKITVCNKCGIKIFATNAQIKKAKVVYCTNKCQLTGSTNPKWGIGRHINHNGYVRLRMPDHPQSHSSYYFEHRFIMEQHLGRYLTKQEVVHHKNGIKTDNRIENLVLCANDSEHQKYHTKEGMKNAMA